MAQLMVDGVPRSLPRPISRDSCTRVGFHQRFDTRDKSPSARPRFAPSISASIPLAAPPQIVILSEVRQSRTQSKARYHLKFVILSEVRRSRTQSKDPVPADKTTNSSKSFHHNSGLSLGATSPRAFCATIEFHRAFDTKDKPPSARSHLAPSISDSIPIR